MVFLTINHSSQSEASPSCNVISLCTSTFVLRARVEPAAYYSPPLYQLSYQRTHMPQLFKFQMQELYQRFDLLNQRFTGLNNYLLMLIKIKQCVLPVDCCTVARGLQLSVFLLQVSLSALPRIPTEINWIVQLKVAETDATICFVGLINRLQILIKLLNNICICAAIVLYRILVYLKVFFKSVSQR